MKRPCHTLLPFLGVLALTNCLAAAEPATAAPAAVGTRACLFLDDRFIAEQSGLKRSWHQGKPRPELAIVEDIGKDKWEKWPHLYGSVLYDPEARVYRMYYESAVWPSRSPPLSFTCSICYAESKDGKTWTKPRLGLFEDLGSKENNIVVPLAEFAKVFIDPLEKDPSARLKMFVWLQAMRAKEGELLYPKGVKSKDGQQVWPMGGVGECLLSSADGIHWKFVEGFNGPDWADPEYTPLSKFTDSRSFMFDPLRQRYMAYIRTMAKSHVAEPKKDSRRRAVGITHSWRVNRGWAPTVHVMEPDRRDDEKVAPLSKDPRKPDWAEHYSLSFFTYGNHYIGMLSLLYLIDDSDANGGGDLQLVYSHDGEKWFRQPDRQTMIAPNSAAPELFPTYVANNGPLEIGDELWLYYTEANGAHPIAPSAGVAKSQIRAATWRKDGFVSLDAAGPASLTTRPVRCDGGRLLLNVKTTREGSARVALLDDRGQPLSGFSAADCEPLRGDQVRGPARWKGQADLSRLKGQAIRLKVELTQGSLYSFRFEEPARAGGDRALRIVCLGDSVTKAAGVKKEQSFCALVEARLAAASRRATVINSGVGSDTTALGLKRFDRDVLAHEPTHCFIMFGLNDAYRPKDKGPLVPLDRYSANLKEMIAVLRARSVVPVLMTSNPYNNKAENQPLKPYIEACRAVARDEKVHLVDVYAHFAELAIEGDRWQRVYTDSCHLNPEGNQIIADLMMKSLALR